MPNKAIIDKTTKITISLPAFLLETVDALVKERQSNRSAVIAEILSEIAKERFEAEMREGYLASNDLTEEITEEFADLMDEVWPEY